MALELDGEWIWDFWLIEDGVEHHLFFLHARRTPEQPDERHQQARIGHAVSSDLTSWTVLPDALAPGEPGSWDDGTTWTGSVIATGDGYAMLYTGTTVDEQRLVQRVGMAHSDDLVHWVKDPANPIIEADPRWYETLDLDAWHDQAWRDPCVVRDAQTGLFHVFLTARAAGGPAESRGVIGHGVSSDLKLWTVTPPIPTPGGFGYMEIPQVLEVEGRWHLVFSAPAWAQSARRGPRLTGTFHAVADTIEGPYREAAPLFVDAAERLYGGRLVATGGRLVCLAFRYLDLGGDLVGSLTDPMPVTVERSGDLVIEAPGL